jgi:peptidyl-prolyl cis-trans isomerase D
MNKMRDSMPVVFAVLAGIFLLMIIFEWGGQGMIFNSKGDAETLGTVDGYKITKKMWEENLETVTAQLKQQKKKTDLTEAEMQQAEDQTWDRCVQQAIINQSIDRMHITVTDQDVRDALFENPPADIRRQFTDSLGQFHAQDYVKALRDPRNDSLVRIMETGLREQIKIHKWQESMEGYVQVTDAELKDRFANENAKATVQVVKVMPNGAEMQQAATQVTDKDLQDYYDSHKYQFKQPEQRKFKFVPFQLAATPRDTASAMESAEAIKRRLESAPPDQLDTVSKELIQDYAPELDASTAGGAHPLNPGDAVTGALATAKPGEVVIAPLAGRIAVVRVTSVSDTGAEVIHTRHIFFTKPGTGTSDSLMALAQQVYGQLKAGGNFEELAHKYSNDFRSAAKGGDVGWMMAPQFPMEIRPAVEHASVNELLPPISAGGGVDIIQVLGRARRSVIGVVVPVSIKPSSQSMRLLQQQASAFQMQAEKRGFDDAAKDASYKVISDAPAASRKGAPIFSSPSFVAWVFSAKKGDISSPIKISEGKATIVAQVTDIIEAGPRPFEEVKQQLKTTVMQNKAIGLAFARAQKAHAAIGANGDLNAAATATGDSTLRPITVMMGPAESVSGIPSGDYVVNNAAFSMKPGQTSDVLKGQNGCYIVKLIDMKPATDEALAAQKQTLITSLLQEKRQRFFSNWIDSRKESAIVVDFRQHR